ncbi:MAG: transporter substrate-binding domain-containing protein [Oscillospiraceae bacterium]|nr:transporter substrate-binding domain-containing protein [Oscillospiraceae bacterium]
MKKIIALTLAMIMALSLVACGKKEEAPKSKIDQIKEAGVLVLGTSADYPPCEFHTTIDGVDTIVGSDIAIAQYIADDLGVELKVVDMAFDSLCISLSEGDFDIVIAGMNETPERAKAVDFTKGYYFGEQVVLVKKANEANYNSTDDLMDKKIAIQRGTIQEGVLKDLGVSSDNVVALVKYQDVLMELLDDKVDVAYIDNMPSLAFASAHDELMVKDIGIEYENEGQAIACQKGNAEFVEYLNGIVDELIEQDLVNQYIAEYQLMAGIE